MERLILNSLNTTAILTRHLHRKPVKTQLRESSPCHRKWSISHRDSAVQLGLFIFSETLLLVANEVLSLSISSWAIVASEAKITPGFMVILHVLLEFAFFGSSSPSAVIGVVWALHRFCMSPKVLIQLAYSMARLTAARPRAIEPPVYNGSYAILLFDCGIPVTIRSERKLRSCNLITKKGSIDVCYVVMSSEMVVM